MKERLVDEVWIDLMPKVFTTGVKLFDGEYFDADLKLSEVRKIADSEVRLRYKVVKYH